MFPQPSQKPLHAQAPLQSTACYSVTLLSVLILSRAGQTRLRLAKRAAAAAANKELSLPDCGPTLQQAGPAPGSEDTTIKWSVWGENKAGMWARAAKAGAGIESVRCERERPLPGVGGSKHTQGFLCSVSPHGDSSEAARGRPTSTEGQPGSSRHRLGGSRTGRTYSGHTSH